MRWCVVFAALAGCDNACQSMCLQMAELSRGCGNSVSDADIDACMDDFADASGEDRGVCRDYSQPEAIQREWTCDDVNLYR